MLIYFHLVYLTYSTLQEERDQMASKMVHYKDSSYESQEKYCVGNSYDLVVTLRSLKEEIRIFVALYYYC